LTVRRRGGRKRARDARAPPQDASQRWSLDFVSDVLADGCLFRALVIVDDFTRECLALVVDTSISPDGLARELDAIVAARSKPTKVVMRKEARVSLGGGAAHRLSRSALSGGL
jgi:putative transposase